MKTIAQIVQHAKTIAVVGLSDKPDRASHEVAAYLQDHGYRILPVNPACAGQQILGEPVFATLQDAAASLDAGVTIDIVDCFRKPDAIVPIAGDAIAVGARCLWMQLAIENDEAARLARDAGLDVIMNRCLKIEHRMLGA
ncbi:CoA-binding protein [Massilia sp. S19_KUP03_FR1]|uniref:CoA-binding protein n=1 Tax=Massilia sp. S19_KUP03_FR1 TaxID=3025503 RepID=UPI002FCD9A73